MNNGKAVAAYWEATFRGKLSESELMIFERALADTALEDAQAAIDDVAVVGGYPPTPQRIAELAETHRKERLRELALAEPEKPALHTDNRPVSFAKWLRDYATDDEKRLVAKNSPKLREKFGSDLADLDGVDA